MLYESVMSCSTGMPCETCQEILCCVCSILGGVGGFFAREISHGCGADLLLLKVRWLSLALCTWVLRFDHGVACGLGIGWACSVPQPSFFSGYFPCECPLFAAWIGTVIPSTRATLPSFCWGTGTVVQLLPFSWIPESLSFSFKHVSVSTLIAQTWLWLWLPFGCSTLAARGACPPRRWLCGLWRQKF